MWTRHNFYSMKIVFPLHAAESRIRGEAFAAGFVAMQQSDRVQQAFLVLRFGLALPGAVIGCRQNRTSCTAIGGMLTMLYHINLR